MKYRILEVKKDYFVPQYKGVFFWKSWKVFLRWDICGEVLVDRGFDSLEGAKSWIKQQHALGEFPKLAHEMELL